MNGWIVLALVAAVAVVLFGLAWWSSGRARPLGRSAGMSETEKDYLASETGRRAGMSGGNNLSGLGG